MSDHQVTAMGSNLSSRAADIANAVRGLFPNDPGLAEVVMLAAAELVHTYDVKVIRHIRTSKSVVAIVWAQLDDSNFELSLVRMVPAAFKAFVPISGIDRVSCFGRQDFPDNLGVRYIDRIEFYDPTLGLDEVLNDLQAHPAWQAALRSSERRALRASIPRTSATAKARARL